LFIPKEKYLNAFSSYKANFEAEKDIYWQSMQMAIAKQKQESQAADPLKKALSIAAGDN